MRETYFAKILLTGQDVLYNQFVEVDNGLVINISSASESGVQADFKGHYLVPSFIDLQIYGARETLFSQYPSAETLQNIYAHCIENGTGYFAITVATNTQEVMRTAIDAVRAYWQDGGKGLLGLHLEGPWINSQKRGAHIEAYVKSPSLEEVKSLLEYGRGVIKIITLAPEVCSDDVLHLIKSYDVVISAGHSNASFTEATQSFSKGITTVTHMYNAMSPLHHRDTGLPGAAFVHPSVMSSIIVDGFHVDYTAVKIAKKLMGDRLFLITDAVTETMEGPYPHHYFEGRYLSEGTLSGSALTMLDSVKNCVKYCDIPVVEACRMAATYPARLMSMQHDIAKQGKPSFLLLDEDYHIIKVCV